MNKSLRSARLTSLCKSLVIASVTAIGLLSVSAHALESLDDETMSDVSGAGIALLPENFKIAFNDLAFIQALPRGAPTFSANNIADLYWYGLQLGAANNVTSRAVATIGSWGTASNPWLLKVESPTGYKYGATTQTAYPVLNYYAPDVLAADVSTGSVNNGGLKYAFWAQLYVRDETNPAGCTTDPTGCAETKRMESQAIWNDFTLNGSRLSIFQNTYDTSFGLSWINRINSTTTGVMRFSVNESTAATGSGPATGAPVFTNNEGLFITDMDINMIVGVQHHQPVILDNGGNTNDAATAWDETKNFVIELVRLSNVSQIYNSFYVNYGVGLPGNGNASYTGTHCKNSTQSCATATHSQIAMGNVSFKNAATGATSWTYSYPGTGTATTANGNLGSTLIDGLMIQHLKITTTGL